jgi:predicted methyltransferase
MKQHRLLVVLFAISATASAQEKSVNPGINKQFLHPNVPEFIERFEKEGRDAFDNREKIVKACEVKPGMAIADIGAGTGLFARMFSPLVGPEGKIYAVEIAEEFVSHIEKTAKQQKLENIVGVVCKPDSVELPPESIDLAFICDTYHHFEFPQKTMRSIHKALKPGGQVILIDFHRIQGVSSDWVMNHVRAGQEVFTKEISDAGFRQVEEKKDVLKESYLVRLEKVKTGQHESHCATSTQEPLRIPLPPALPGDDEATP